MIQVDTLLAWGATYKKVQKGDYIFREGGYAGFYYQLEEGSVRWVNVDDNGKEFIQMMVSPGECFGELPLFDGMPYAATAIANEDSVILRLHQSTFHDLLRENPDIHFTFSRMLSERIRFKFLTLKALAYNDPELRISTMLQHFKQTNKNICSQCHRVKLTRQQIADMTGLRVETVIRTLRHMHDKGQLLIEKGKVYC